LEFVPTGCETLDELIGGGLPTGAISLVYGEAGCGKSTLCIQVSVNCARKGQKAIYVDADQSFSYQRLAQIAYLDAQEAGERIVVFSPESFEEQRNLIEGLEAYMSKAIKVVILDSVTNLYRAAIAPGEKAFRHNRELNRQLAYLADLATNHDLAVLVTGQVHTKPIQEARPEPVARRLLFYWPKAVINILPTAARDVKEVLVEKSFQGEGGGSCLVRLTDRGIEPHS